MKNQSAFPELNSPRQSGREREAGADRRVVGPDRREPEQRQRHDDVEVVRRKRVPHDQHLLAIAHEYEEPVRLPRIELAETVGACARFARRSGL